MSIANGIVIVAWLAFFVYWAVSAIGVKKDMPGKGNWERWALGRIAIIIVAILLLDFPGFSGFWANAKGWAIFQNPITAWTGAILTAAGIAFAIWARYHLGRNWSGRPTMKIDHELVTSGPYRFVRHPIYTGMAAALIGSAFVGGPAWAIACLFFIFVFVWRIRAEESFMLELFPGQYPAYRARTKALIPFVW